MFPQLLEQFQNRERCITEGSHEHCSLTVHAVKWNKN